MVPRDMSADKVPSSLASLVVSMGDLKPYGANPRRGNVGALVESLTYHGQYRPLVVRRETGEILAGNHTFMAARELGWSDIAVTYVDCDDDEAARIVLVDNRSNDLASYGDEALAEILSSLDGFDGSGFNAGDLEDLLLSLSESPKSLDDLAAEVGEPLADDGWELVSVRVPASVKASWDALVDTYSGDGAAALSGLLGVDQ